MTTDKTYLIEHARHMAQWPVYLTIGNLSHEVRRLQLRLRGMMIGPITIYKKDFLEVKIEIYHQTMEVIIKGMFKSLFLCMVV